MSPEWVDGHRGGAAGGSGRGLGGLSETQSSSMSRYVCHFCIDSHTWTVSYVFVLLLVKG